jgi:hypothetical protein
VRDCADVIISQIEAVAKAKELFPDLIYSQSYEALVNKPEEEIKSLVKWLGWNWNSCYLSPHHNRRAVNTASVLQVRSPINNRSVNGWMNFLELLAPAVPILSEHHLFKGLADEFEEARSRAASEKTQ